MDHTAIDAFVREAIRQSEGDLNALHDMVQELVPIERYPDGEKFLPKPVLLAVADSLNHVELMHAALWGMGDTEVLDMIYSRLRGDMPPAVAAAIDAWAKKETTP